MSTPLAFYLTAPDAATAEAIAEALVARRLAACVNVIPGMRSVYRWAGEIQRGAEFVLIAKSTSDRAAALRAAVAEIHPDETPCIVALAIVEDASAPAFLAWIERETTESRG